MNKISIAVGAVICLGIGYLLAMEAQRVDGKDVYYWKRMYDLSMKFTEFATSSTPTPSAAPTEAPGGYNKQKASPTANTSPDKSVCKQKADAFRRVALSQGYSADEVEGFAQMTEIDCNNPQSKTDITIQVR